MIHAFVHDLVELKLFGKTDLVGMSRSYGRETQNMTECVL